MGAAALDKLKAYGIAPPHRTSNSTIAWSSAPRARSADSVVCPQCGSTDTTEISHFGSTACKALYRCLSCLEPFDYFKPY
jgi:ring-1,2-phenylacetyl-CoA epoxidase subunit PaaD